MNAEIMRDWFALVFWLCAVGVPMATLLYGIVILVWESLSKEEGES